MSILAQTCPWHCGKDLSMSVLINMSCWYPHMIVSRQDRQLEVMFANRCLNSFIVPLAYTLHHNTCMHTCSLKTFFFLPLLIGYSN